MPGTWIRLGCGDGDAGRRPCGEASRLQRPKARRYALHQERQDRELESSSVHMDTERRVAGEATRLTQGQGVRALAYRVDRLLDNGDRAGPGGTAFEEIIVARATEHSDPPRI
ncbi:hypothetical protein L1887_54476 [Cichorium endivia]|nr:hypothetical protein L1887_54476 [Cichorium endivia]